MRLDRRTFLAGAAGFVGCSSVRPWRAMAASPHRFRNGSFNITVLSDGHFMLPAEVVAPDAMPAEWVDIEKRLGGSSGAIDAKCNVPLIRTEKDLILFDLGTDDPQGPAEPGHPGFHQRVRLPARPSSLTLHGVGEHDAQCAYNQFVSPRLLPVLPSLGYFRRGGRSAGAETVHHESRLLHQARLRGRMTSRLSITAAF